MISLTNLLSFNVGSVCIFDLLNLNVNTFSFQGLLPKDIDLTYASQKCKEVLLDTLGVQATPKVIVVSSPKIISYQEDIIATAAREALKNSSNTERSKILEYENIILNLQTKITEYENYIKEKYIPPTP